MQVGFPADITFQLYGQEGLGGDHLAEGMRLEPSLQVVGRTDVDVAVAEREKIDVSHVPPAPRFPW